MSSIQQVSEGKIVAIMRGVKPEDAYNIAKALKKGGIKIFEVTLDSPNALEIIKQLSEEEGDDIVIGAGTVLDPESARMAIRNGATFVISPTMNTKTIEMTKRYGATSIPGCLTPTEMLTAYEYGADIVKVFPAGTMGPRYFKDVLGPLAQIPLMATGGINEKNILDFLETGIVAVGLGSSLVPKEMVDDVDLQKLTEKAAKLVQMVTKYK